MALTNPLNKITYDLDGVTSVFAYDFKIFANSEMDVTVVNKTTGAVTAELTLSVDFTVSGAGNASGGNVTLIASLYDSDEQLVLRGIAPYTQEIGFVNNEVTTKDTWEEGFDRSVRLSQQLKEEVDRSIKTTVGASVTPVLPAPVDGNVMVWQGVDGTLVNAPYSIDDLNDATADAQSAAVSASASASGAASSASAAQTAETNAQAAQTAAEVAQAAAEASAASIVPAQFKVGNFTRDVSIASGNQAVTGVGFQPSAIIFLSSVNGSADMSIGVDNDTASRLIYDAHAAGAGTYTQQGGSIHIQPTGGTSYDGSIGSFDADGFTIAWVKGGTPTGTLTMSYLAIK